jgi:hydroxymethylbilane synthase
MIKKIRIGTRKSKLATAQTALVADALKQAFCDIETEIVPIVTHGDRVLDKPLGEMGGKGVFVAEIERLLAAGEIDIAVHSAKDLPLELAAGSEIAAVLARGNHRDTLVTLADSEIDCNSCFTVGTGSLRRMRNLSRTYPLAQYKGIRGNADTRLAKLKSGEYDAVVLAAAGLERLGITENDGYEIVSFESGDFLPAPCQGIIAVQCMKGTAVEEYLRKINDSDTYLCFETERQVLKLLDADCTMPVGAYASLSDGVMSLEVSADGIEFASGSADVSERFLLAERLVNML